MTRQRAKVRVLAALLSFLLAASCLPGIWGVNGLALGNSGRGSAYTLGDSEEGDSLFRAAAGDLSLGTSDVEITDFSAPSTFRTYTSQPSGAAIEQLAVTVDIAVRTKTIADTEVVIPLDYETGHLDKPYFTYASYILKDDGADIIDSVEVEGDELIISLKENAPANSVQSITLYFAFDDEYDAKVPVGTVLWEDIRAFVRVDGKIDSEVSSGELMTDSRAALRFRYTEMLPGDGTLEIGAKSTLRLLLYNDYYYQTELDYPIEEIWYFPAGTIFNKLDKFTDKGIAEDGRAYIKRTMSSFAGWRYPNYGGNYNTQTFNQDDVSFILPESIPDGEIIAIQAEVTYRYHGQDEDQKLNYTISLPARKADVWDFYLTDKHAGSDISTRFSVSDIDIQRESNVSVNSVYTGYKVYFNASTTRNQGAGPIGGVHLKLYQVNDDSDSPKVNYHSIILQRDRVDTEYAFTQYRYYFTVADAKANSTYDTVEQFIASNSGGTFELNLPDLAPGEYINTVHLIPYGADASKDELKGQLLARNSLCLEYVIKTWDDMNWPDGSPMDRTTRTLVPTQWSLDYRDAEGKEAVHYSKIYNHIYAWHPVYPYAKLANVDANAGSLVPGGTVDYQIQGYNDYYYSRSGWVRPVITVSVPSSLTIAADFTTTLRDVSDGDQGKVSWQQLPDAADGSHVYRFTAPEDYTAPVSSSAGMMGFTIPVTFQIAPGTASGTHTIPGVMVSSAGAGSDFIMGHETTVTVPSGIDPADYGYGDGDNFSYVTKLSHDPFSIIPAMELTSSTQIQTTLTGGWSSQLVVPVGVGGEAGIKLQVANRGNLPVGNVALYDIMPFAGYLQSVPVGMSAGDLMASLTKVTVNVDGSAVSSGSLYLNTGLAVRDQAVDKVSFVDTGDGTWTKYDGAMPPNVTALYFDYEDNVLQPGQTLEIVLTFAIPDRDENMDYTVYNVFGYCGTKMENGTADPSRISFASPQHGFTSELFTIVYEANGSNVTNLPNTELFHNFKDPSVTVAVSTGEPEREKYTFTGWNTGMDGKGTGYDAGQALTVTSPGILTLYAQWEGVPAAPVNVSIRKVDSEDSARLLPGAVFRLYKTDESPEQDYGSKTTDNDGIAGWENLPAGTYRLEEEDAPDGYECLAGSIRFTLWNDDGVLVIAGADAPVDGSDPYRLCIANEKEQQPPVIPEARTTDITIRKVDGGDSAIRLSGAVFRLYKVSGGQEQDLGAVTTQRDGAAQWVKLEAGNYRLEEQTPPGGYLPLKDSVYFELVEAGENFSVKVTGNAASKEDERTLLIPNEKIQVTTEGAKLTAVKSSNPVSGSAVNTGDTITYTVAVTNTGDEPAEKVVVTDVVPQYTSYVADSATNSGVHNSDTNTVTWELGTLEPGKTVKVGFQVKVQSIANNTERTIRNVAQYRHDGEAPATTNATLHYQKRKDSGSDGGKDPGTDKPDEHDRTPGTDGGGNNGGRDRSKDFGSSIDIHDEDIPLATTLLTLLDEDTPLSNLDIPDTGLWRYFWMIQLIPSLCLTVVGISLIAGSRRKEE